MEKNIIIYDVTLREGEQVAGISFSPDEKVSIALELLAAGITHLEIGVWGIEEDEIAYNKLHSQLLKKRNIEISLILLPFEKLISKAVESSILNFNLVWPCTQEFSQHLLGQQRITVIQMLDTWVPHLVSSGKSLRIVMADASRLPVEDLQQQLEECRKKFGVSKFILSDTLGILTPEKTIQMFKRLTRRLPFLEFGVHFHNDFGMAVANSLVAAEHGASLIQVSINGLGERAGIAPMAEVVAALLKLYGCNIKIDLKKILQISRKIEEMTGLISSLRMPIVGRSLFWTETATHVFPLLDGHLEAIAPLSPDELGETYRIVLGKHTSKRLFNRLRNNLNVSKFNSVEELREYARRKKQQYANEIRSAMRKYLKAWERSIEYITLVRRGEK